MLPRKTSSPLRSTRRLTKRPEKQFRDHLQDEAEDSLLHRWTKLGEAVLAHGGPTEEHISEMTRLARAEQEEIKARMRRIIRIYKQGERKAA